MRQESQRRGRRSVGEGSAAYLGCRTCRIRRIKCDGARPACNNCLSQSRSCLGYTSWDVSLVGPSGSRASNDASADSLQLNPASGVSSIPLCVAHAIDDVARQGFDYFRYRNRFAYAERGYPTLWTTTSIAMGMHGESAVFYAMAALGTAEQALVPTFHTSLARPVDDALREKAFRMYSKAIGYLQDPMRKASSSNEPLDAIILACAIFLVNPTSWKSFHCLRQALTVPSLNI